MWWVLESDCVEGCITEYAKTTNFYNFHQVNIWYANFISVKVLPKTLWTYREIKTLIVFNKCGEKKTSLSDSLNSIIVGKKCMNFLTKILCLKRNILNINLSLDHLWFKTLTCLLCYVKYIRESQASLNSHWVYISSSCFFSVIFLPRINFSDLLQFFVYIILLQCVLSTNIWERDDFIEHITFEKELWKEVKNLIRILIFRFEWKF